MRLRAGTILLVCTAAAVLASAPLHARDAKPPPGAPPPRPTYTLAELQRAWETPPPPAQPAPDADLESAFRKAELNGRLAAEQLSRCRLLMDAWLRRADPKSGLLPADLKDKSDLWTPEESGAVVFPFVMLTAALTDGPLFGTRVRDMLLNETCVSTRVEHLPEVWSFRKQDFAQDAPDVQAALAGGTVYGMEGLLFFSESLAPGRWSERLQALAEDVWKLAPVKTAQGLIPSSDARLNGLNLQLAARLYWMTGEKKYLEWAVRLGDHYLLDAPPLARSAAPLVLGAGGGELVMGLCELYAALSFADPEKKKTYEAPLHELCDRILAAGRNEHGMFYQSFNPQSGEHASAPAAAWGHAACALYTVYLVDKTDAYREAVMKALASLKPHYRGFDWPGPDGKPAGAAGLAAALESALYLLGHEDDPSATEWLDGEVGRLWQGQQQDGVLTGRADDCRTARAALLYALWKTQGLHASPWAPGVRVGAVRKGEELYLSVYAEQAWSGSVVFDKDRHKFYFLMRLDYPRPGHAPEWFAVRGGPTYQVRNLTTGKTEAPGGKTLRGGLGLELKPRTEVRMVVALKRARDPSGTAKP